MTYADAFNIRTSGVKFNDVGDAIDGVLTRDWAGTTSGTSTAYTASTSPTFTALTTGQPFALLPHTDNTGSTTVDFNSIGTKTVKFMGQNLIGGEMKSGVIAWLRYDGTNLHLLNHAGGYQTWTPTFTCSGSLTFPSATISLNRYQRFGSLIEFWLQANTTTGGTASTDIYFTLPVTAAAAYGGFTAQVTHGSYNGVGGSHLNSTTSGVVYRHDGGNWTSGTSTFLRVRGSYWA